MILIEAGVTVLALAAIGLLYLLEHLLDRPEDLGKVTPGWLRRDRDGRGQC